MAEVTLEIGEKVEMKIETDPYIACRQSEVNAKFSEENAKASANIANDSAVLAQISANVAKENKEVSNVAKIRANNAASNAASSEENAKNSEQSCKNAENSIEMQNEINKSIFAKAFINTEKGIIASVSDAAKDIPIKTMKIYGNSVQESVPTRENPVAVKSTADNGEVKIKVLGKNLWDINETTKKFSSIRREIYLVAQQSKINFDKTSVILSFEWEAKELVDSVYVSTCINNVGYVNYCTRDSETRTMGTNRYTLNGSNGRVVVSSPPLTGNMHSLDLYVNNLVGAQEVSVSNIQLEVSSTVTDYEQYITKETTIPCTPLHGALYRRGVEIKDILNIDIVNKKIWVDRKCHRYIFNGNERWYVRNQTDAYISYQSTAWLTKAIGYDGWDLSSSKSSVYKWGYVSGGSVTGIAIFNAIRYTIPKDIHDGDKMFKDGDYIIYALREPYTEELPWKDEYALLAQGNNLNVTCIDDVQTKVEIEYIQDPNIVINDLKKLILELNTPVGM